MSAKISLASLLIFKQVELVRAFAYVRSNSIYTFVWASRSESILVVIVFCIHCVCRILTFINVSRIRMNHHLIGVHAEMRKNIEGDGVKCVTCKSFGRRLTQIRANKCIHTIQSYFDKFRILCCLVRTHRRQYSYSRHQASFHCRMFLPVRSFQWCTVHRCSLWQFQLQNLVLMVLVLVLFYIGMNQLYFHIQMDILAAYAHSDTIHTHWCLRFQKRRERRKKNVEIMAMLLRNLRFF